MDDIQSELLVAHLLEEDFQLWISTLAAAKLQLDEVLSGSASLTGSGNVASEFEDITSLVDDADFALRLYMDDLRRTSDATYVESLQVEEEKSLAASRQYALSVAAAESKLRLDAEFAKKLQEIENAGRGADTMEFDVDR